jgi:hypothetical protein
MYSGWVNALFPRLWEEVRQMGRRSSSGPVLNWRPAIEEYGLKAILDQVIDVNGVGPVVAELGLDKVIAEVGLDRVLESAPAPKVIEAIGLDRFLSQLTAKQRRDMLRRLQDESR